MLRVGGRHLRRRRLEPRDQDAAGGQPHARAALHLAQLELGLVPLRDRPVRQVRGRRALRHHLHLQPGERVAPPAGEPARRPRRRRGGSPLRHRPVPRDVARVRRLASWPARPTRQAGADRPRGHDDRGGVPDRRSEVGHLASVPPDRARPLEHRAALRRDPDGGARRGRRRRHVELHAVAVQPRRQPARPHVGRPGARPRRCPTPVGAASSTGASWRRSTRSCSHRRRRRCGCGSRVAASAR